MVMVTEMWMRCAKETIVQRAGAGTSGRVGRSDEEVSRAALEEDREAVGIWRAVAGGLGWGDQI
jgi:hypothetical protein